MTATNKRHRPNAERDAAIVKAVRKASHQSVADRYGISRPRVYQIVEKARSEADAAHKAQLDGANGYGEQSND